MIGNPNERIFSRCAEKVSDEDVRFFPGDLIENLIMFDCFIIDSIRLKELPFLLRILGFEGVRELIKSGKLKINCQVITTGQTGQFSLDPSKTVLPYGSYEFSVIVSSNQKEYIHSCFDIVNDIDELKGKQKIKIKEIISNSFLVFPDESIREYMNQLKLDILHKPELIISTVNYLINRDYGHRLDEGMIKLDVDHLGDDKFKINTNLNEIINVIEIEEHKIIERAILTLSGSNQRISQMKAFNSISSFREEDLPIFRKKFDYLSQSITSQDAIAALRKVMKINNLPDFRSVDFTGRLDIDKLLTIRESDECKLFRSLIWSLSKSTEQEIQEIVDEYRNKVGQYLRTPIGKTVRFLTGAGIGMIPVVGGVISTGLGLIDNFILEKLFPVNGAIVFLDNKLPSIIKK
jgi:hypothetical protein